MCDILKHIMTFVHTLLHMIRPKASDDDWGISIEFGFWLSLSFCSGFPAFRETTGCACEDFRCSLRHACAQRDRPGVVAFALEISPISLFENRLILHISFSRIIATYCTKAPFMEDIELMDMVPAGRPRFGSTGNSCNYLCSVYIKFGFQGIFSDIPEPMIKLRKCDKWYHRQERLNYSFGLRST